MTPTTLNALCDIQTLLIQVNVVDFGEAGKASLAAFNDEFADLLDVALCFDSLKTADPVGKLGMSGLFGYMYALEESERRNAALFSVMKAQDAFARKGLGAAIAAMTAMQTTIDDLHAQIGGAIGAERE